MDNTRVLKRFFAAALLCHIAPIFASDATLEGEVHAGSPPPSACVGLKCSDASADGDPIRSRAMQRQDAVMVKTSPVQASPGPSATAAVSVIGEGNAVRIVESRGGWKRIESNTTDTGWVPGEVVVPVSQFRRVSRWKHPTRVEVGDGDYSATYRFNSDGRFVVSETKQDADESYRLVQRRGKLYAFRGIVWARVGNEPPYASRMFLQKGKTFCWQGYLDGRCP